VAGVEQVNSVLAIDSTLHGVEPSMTVVAALRSRSAGETMEIIGSDGTTYTTNPDGSIQQKIFHQKESTVSQYFYVYVLCMS